MGLTVFAESMGFFHKGSGGTGIAMPDVCLSPPPPPAGPVPIPYPNNLSASDLTKGSKTVKIDGEPTALEDASEVSTSTGDEGGTQGGNVVTHKTKGKGFFTLWSFTVKVEGKGVGRNGDLMGQNAASLPAGTLCPGALTSFSRLAWMRGNYKKPCTKGYSRPKEADQANKAQWSKVLGKPCWTGCGRSSTVRDHQPPANVAWYLGGCHNPKAYKKWLKQARAVQPQCATCSSKQGGNLNNIRGTRTMMSAIGLS